MNCRACSTHAITPFLDLGVTPLADSFSDFAAEARDHHPLKVAVCERCWLVQLHPWTDVPDSLLFGGDYAFFSGSSPTLTSHFSELAQYVMATYPGQCEEGVLEIACNDGSLLEHFHRADFPSVGVDPAGPPTELARSKGLDVRTSTFTGQLEELGQAGVILALNVLAHVKDPTMFLWGVADRLLPDGVAILEFQYLPDLLVRNDWSLFYHEHRSYFSLTALENVCASVGLSIRRVRHIDTQGGSMRVELERQRGGGLHEFNEGWLRNHSTYESVQGRVDYSVGRLQEVCSQFSHISGYGASAKLTTLIHYAGLEDTLESVEDLTPYKIGKYMPGTDIPIVRHADRPDAYLLSIPNYLSGVLDREHAYRGWGGKFILPSGEVI